MRFHPILSIGERIVLKDQLNWNMAGINFMANLIIAFLKTRTVCLTDIATALSGKAKTESKYKKPRRFFRSYEMDIDSVSLMVAAILPISKEKWTLSIDRTNWKLGKANINVFCLGICCMGACFPVIWLSLDKRGNSNTDERITLIEKFIDLFGKAKIRCLTADREFIGNKWFEYLLNEKIPFRIR